MKDGIFAEARALTAAFALITALLMLTSCAGPPRSVENEEATDIYRQASPMRNVNDHYYKAEKPEKTRLPIDPLDVPYEIKDEEAEPAIFMEEAVAVEFVADEVMYEPQDESEQAGGYEVEYDEMYNTDGPTRQMPGWHDGNLETYYNASNHFMADEWTVDDEGFYRDSEGRYVIGVDEESGYSYGDVVETGKGEGVVYDYGSGISNLHDFATIW